ncbi:MAG: hypothetical protein MUP71_12970 [Candidatus Aminicenantes bacterium]|nr:hypothetical protein [Candidatus Aminicenantes bacterium]
MKKLGIAIMGIVFLLAPLVAQSVTVTYPNGGESLVPGSAGRITWTASRASQNVKLILLREDNSIYGVIVRDLAPDSSPYSWTVGDTRVGRAPEGRYKIRVSTMNGGSKDVSDAAFAIAAGSSPEPEPAAESSKADFAKIGQQLQRYAKDLRDVGKSMQVHARTTMPEGLNKDQEAILAAQRHDLEATAAAALELAIQIENRESNAQGRTLTRADMDSLGVAAHALTVRINQRLPGASTPKKLNSGKLNDIIKEVESMQETNRNKRQMASTAFENFDQNANHLFNLLSSVMKGMNEMSMGIGRNIL